MSQPPNTRSSSDESGTTSLIFGERPSVRFPRRTVPICVNDPIGLARPFRMATTPAIVVGLTAPRPTSSTPNLPRAGAISTGVDTGENYISGWELVTSGWCTDPVTSNQSPVTSYQVPATSDQSTATVLRSEDKRRNCEGQMLRV